MIIYKATNLINSKVYIGQTTQTLQKRISNHLGDSKRSRKAKATTKFSKAILKYGIVNFKFEVLHSTDSIEELNRLELLTISEYDSCNDCKGYNLLLGGHQGGRHSEETKKKISLGSINAAKEAKENGQHWNVGRICSEEKKAHLRELLTGVKCPAKGVKSRGDTNPMKNPDIVKRMVAKRTANRLAKLAQTVTSV